MCVALGEWLKRDTFHFFVVRKNNVAQHLNLTVFDAISTHSELSGLLHSPDVLKCAAKCVSEWKMLELWIPDNNMPKQHYSTTFQTWLYSTSNIITAQESARRIIQTSHTNESKNKNRTFFFLFKKPYIYIFEITVTFPLLMLFTVWNGWFGIECVRVFHVNEAVKIDDR